MKVGNGRSKMKNWKWMLILHFTFSIFNFTFAATTATREMVTNFAARVSQAATNYTDAATNALNSTLLGSITNKADKSELGNYIPIRGGTFHTGAQTWMLDDWGTPLTLYGIEADVLSLNKTDPDYSAGYWRCGIGFNTGVGDFGDSTSGTLYYKTKMRQASDAYGTYWYAEKSYFEFGDAEACWAELELRPGGGCIAYVSDIDTATNAVSQDVGRALAHYAMITNAAAALDYMSFDSCVYDCINNYNSILKILKGNQQ